MKNEWIIDVLNDLRVVAKRNGMDATAKRIDDACLTALAEMGNAPEGKTGGAHDKEGDAQVIVRLIAGRDLA